MNKTKIMFIFGTRPEAIKMAPLILEMKERKEKIETIVTVTAQHREMLDQVLDNFNITPDVDLNIMSRNQTLSDITTLALKGIEEAIQIHKPDVILVHGDTTTTFAASLAGFYNKVKVGHVEAGLRTHDKFSPFPEEMNRQLTGQLADYHFAPTKKAAKNLLEESKNKSSIFITGNTAIDCMLYTISEEFHHPIFDIIKDQKMILLTSHRRENLGNPMVNIFKSILKVVNEHEDIHVVFPVHLNPIIQEEANSWLGNHPRIHLIPPLNVVEFHNFMNRSYLILTDSGGIQEEAPSLGKPVLVLRDTTERSEGVDAGTLKLIGTESDNIYREVKLLLENEEEYNKMAKATNPFGDGTASKQIANILEKELTISTDVLINQ